MRERVRSVHAPRQKNGLTVRLHNKAARAEVRSEEQKWREVPMPLPVTRTMGAGALEASALLASRRTS